MACQNFDFILTTILQELKDCGKLNEIGKVFGIAEEAEFMFRYIFQEPVVYKTLAQHTKISLSGKSEEEAEKLRLEGNNLFKNKCYGLALDMYNMSILAAPHPPWTNGPYTQVNDLNESQQSYISLALGYAERSRLLFELKEFMRCVEDINRAMKFESVKSLYSELMKRKAKCYFLLRMYKEAKEALDCLLISSSSVNKDVPKRTAQLNNLSKLCQSTEESVPDDENKDNDTLHYTMPTKEDWVLFQYKKSHPPEVRCTNPSVPSFSDALKVEYDQLRGRYVVATRDISPGEVLAKAKSYVCVPDTSSSNIRTHCTLCLLRCHNPIPCPTCARVVFCSEKCREEGMKKFHNIECQFLPTLIDLGIDKTALQAFRLVIGETFTKLKDCVPMLRKEAKENSRHSHGFNDEGFYNTNDYRTIYHLEGNIKSRSVLDSLHKSTEAYLLTNMLHQTEKFFINGDGKAFVPTDEDLILTGSVLLNHLFNIPQNTFAITELQVNIEDFRNDVKQQNIAGGCYSALSLFNHSCCSYAARANYGDVLVIYARRFIPAGCEVTLNYGYSYHEDKKEQRQDSLFKDYKFICSCEACKEDWPLFDDLPDVALRSVKTFIKYPDDSDDSKTLDYDNNDAMNAKLENILVRYHTVLKRETKENISESTLQEAVEFMERFCIIPCKEHYVAQSMMVLFQEFRSTSYCFMNK